MNFRKLACLLLALLVFVCTVSFAETDTTNTIDQILTFASRGEDMQAWLDKTLVDGIGSATDGYVLSLRKLGKNLDYSAYNAAVAEMLSTNAVSNPVTRQKCALILLVNGATELVPDGIADETIGKLGVMSYAYGIHLLVNGAESKLWTLESLKEKLLTLQIDDGGWDVRGMYSDPDVTAMVLQALNLLPEIDSALEEAFDRSVEYLSAAQKDSGGYSSYGIENAESIAQVITALCSMDIDPLKDERFIKNGNSPWDALQSYRLDNNAYSHQAGGDADENACVQALQAAIAMTQYGTDYYDFSGLEPAKKAANTISWKFIALIAIAVFAIAGALLSFIKPYGRMKRIVLILLVSAVAAVAVLSINIQAASDYYGTGSEAQAPVTGEAYISIRCDLVAGKSSEEVTPSSGIILDRTAISIHEGDTVFDVLTSAVRSAKIQMDYSGANEKLAYMNGINNLYEHAYGELSGWIYSLNGEIMSVGCGSCEVSPGDEIQWNYTLNMGDDLR